MKEERRLVGRVLRHWTEIANGGRFPRRDVGQSVLLAKENHSEIDPWMLGEDGANLVLSPYWGHSRGKSCALFST
jgi:hypothetical protein